MLPPMADTSRTAKVVALSDCLRLLQTATMPRPMAAAADAAMRQVPSQNASRDKSKVAPNRNHATANTIRAWIVPCTMRKANFPVTTAAMPPRPIVSRCEMPLSRSSISVRAPWLAANSRKTATTAPA